MNYRSLSDLSRTIVSNMHRLPSDIDLVVGIPRSGLLASNILSLVTDIPMTDLDSFLNGRIIPSDTPKKKSQLGRNPADMRRILVLDDSIQTGETMRRAREMITAAGLQEKVVFAAVYGLGKSHPEVDYVFEEMRLPRYFEWNFMHHENLERACVDIDGVLCADPTEQENDDGEAYRKFLSEAVPLYTPSRRIGWLVTSRLEKYRDLTETWMNRQGIEYGELVMLDLPSKEERQRLKVHGSFKANFYRESSALLFIESEERQAKAIAQLSGKPVLCVETHQLYLPELLSAPTGQRKSHNPSIRVARKILGEQRFNFIKKKIRFLFASRNV